MLKNIFNKIKLILLISFNLKDHYILEYMPSGIVQLLAAGAQDKILISNPQFNHFKQVFRKHSNFSTFNYELPVTSKIDFDNTVQLEIPKNGDLLRRIQLKVDLPTLSINYNNPSNVEIENIKTKYSYKSINLETYNYNLYNLNTFKETLEYELGYSSNITHFETFLYNSNSNVETYNVTIPKIDLNQYITPSTTEFYFDINYDKSIFSNSKINFNYPLIDTPIIDKDYNSFNNETLLYANRNNKLTVIFNLLKNLFETNDQTLLLTSDNIQNILLKNIKDYIFQNEEFASIDSLQKYIDSIRFIRPISLYDSVKINNLINGGDSDLINYSTEYAKTYYKTTSLQQIISKFTIINTKLNSLTSRLLYVLTTTPQQYNVMYNGILYGLYNILKIDFMNVSELNANYNELDITSYLLFNYTDLLQNINNINNMKIKITPISQNANFDLYNFSQLYSINSIELLIQGEYKISIDLFLFDNNLVGKYIYFYYNLNIDDDIILPICILQITNYYILDNKVYLFAKTLDFGANKDYTTNLLYLVNNNYIFQTNTVNSDDYDIKKISVNNINSDSITIYQNYISQTDNINFNLDGTINTENQQRTNFKTNFTNYIITNLKDNYAILYNIIASVFKQPYDYQNINTNAKNLYFKVVLTNDGIGGLSLSGIGQSTFTEQDSYGNSIMIKFLSDVLTKNFDNLTITNNYYLSIINTAISNYSSSYQNNWNNINNIIQKAPYMTTINRAINHLSNTDHYIQMNIDANLFVTSEQTQINVFNGHNLVTSFNVIDKNFIEYSNISKRF